MAQLNFNVQGLGIALYSIVVFVLGGLFINYLSAHVNPAVDAGAGRVRRWWSARAENRQLRWAARVAPLVDNQAEQQQVLLQALAARLRGLGWYGSAAALFFFAGLWTFSGPRPWVPLAMTYVLRFAMALLAVGGFAANRIASDLERMVSDAKAIAHYRATARDTP